MSAQIINSVINKAIDYIIINLNNDINVDDVADHCNFSRFYFSRMFRAETGESLYAFIKRLRMEYSAVRIGAQKNKSISDIGLDYGYSSSNYSSAFKKQHKMSPYEFRRDKAIIDKKHPFVDMQVELKSFDFYDECIQIEEIPDFKVLFKRYIGNYLNMREHWCEFIKTYSFLCNEKSRYLEITYDDPKITDINRCIYDICMTVDSSLNELENIKTIQGGLFAVYKMNGSISDIFPAYKGIFNVWLPECKFQLDNRIGFDIYESADSETDSFSMNIYIPIKK